jgi:RNA polymerase sigma factor (sigma-70 family)
MKGLKMDNLNLLAKEFKRTKLRIISNRILTLLSAPIHQKATYVFYKQQFIKEKFKIEVFDKKTKTYKIEERVKCFRLCDTKKLEIEDIEQELNLKVLELLENYDARKPFSNYLFGTLKNWRPSYIQDVNFIKDLDTQNESELPDKENEQQTLDDVTDNYQSRQNEEIELDYLFENLTEAEKKFIKLRLKNPQKNQSELALIIGVSQERVSQIIEGLRKKVK